MTMENTDSPFGGCDCREMLQLVLDGAASTEQMEHFRHHLSGCKMCNGEYEVHSTIQVMLREKCCSGNPPEDLVLQIRSKLNL